MGEPQIATVVKRILTGEHEVTFASAAYRENDDEQVFVALSVTEWYKRGCQESYVVQLTPGDWIPE